VNEVLEWIAPSGAATLLTQRQGGKGRWAPPVRMVTDKVFGQAGARVRSVNFDMGNVVVPVLLNTATTDDYRTLLRTMASSLNPLTGPGLLRSTVTWASGTVEVRELSCYYTAGMDVPEDYLDVGYASLLFTAPDPFWYGDNQTFAWQSPPTIVNWFPILPLQLGTSQVFKRATLSNAGDAEAWPVWSITGPTTGELTLTNDITSDVFGLAYEIPASATVTIDTRPNAKTVTATVGNLFPYLTSPALWPLVTGTNAVTMVIPGASGATTVAVTYRQCYLAA
jgi:phage-related protein